MLHQHKKIRHFLFKFSNHNVGITVVNRNEPLSKTCQVDSNCANLPPGPENKESLVTN